METIAWQSRTQKVFQTKKEALLKAIDKKFKDDPEQAEDLKTLINDWAELRIKMFTDRRSWVRNPEKDKK